MSQNLLFIAISLISGWSSFCLADAPWYAPNPACGIRDFGYISSAMHGPSEMTNQMTGNYEYWVRVDLDYGETTFLQLRSPNNNLTTDQIVKLAEDTMKSDRTVANLGHQAHATPKLARKGKFVDISNYAKRGALFGLLKNPYMKTLYDLCKTVPVPKPTAQQPVGSGRI